ncbi:N-formylglutamate amidohydrolase [Imperialibacter roseus]|uniref:N-formylglutamate amidohydrolase n=1 Tax=Imperialibacter roseus TaxID=1324217 RepID=A0ABZ0IZE9_9BACT|nr:N-formylglutamate amidohydrolase [Imperialibacter roseus]WOK09325.1 N-formylglutamate amidohydrolase [Imperialibacter roseus]|tara:strand:- start:32965 stop:33678 length:714 start_codon:yes stop_codon:yes gene_type:complete
MSKVKFILTCEHGGNEIPEEYEYLFNKTPEVLKTHRGLDIGALALFEQLKAIKADSSYFSTTSRLLVELNRSRNHKSLFSEYTKPLQKIVRRHILTKYYTPYRNTVYAQIYKWVSKGNRVVHISVHTFTPIFEGKERKVDIGLLFDPKKKPEKEFCGQWKSEMKSLSDMFAVKFNEPYLGKSDGFTTFLRKEFDSSSYTGIELEVNQKFYIAGGHQWPEDILKLILNSYKAMVKKVG